MNLLLYTEARQTLAQRRARLNAGLPRHSDCDPVSLPDSLFAELGYFGALEELHDGATAGAETWQRWPAGLTRDQLWAARPVIALPTSI
jgi:hypothetical protein